MADKLSEDDFRKALYESLNKKGLVSSFKSHMRQQIAMQLALKDKGVIQGTSGPELVSDMLTAAHLKYANYEYSLSTFLSEANISDKNLSMGEWLRLLEVSEDSALSRNLQDTITRSPLLSFLTAVVSTCGKPIGHTGVQTEAMSLQDKFRHLDDKYSNMQTKLSSEDTQLQSLFSNNKKVQEVIKVEVERFKELELERYKLLEKDALNKQFNKKLADFEEDYRQRLDSLHRREVESARAYDTMRTETEAALYADRQTLLSELESLRARSQQLEREQQLSKSQVELEREKYAVMSARLQERDQAILAKEEDYKNRMSDHMEKAKLQCKAALRDREGEVAAKERQLQEEVEEKTRTLAELEAHRAEVTKLRKENNDITNKLVLNEAQLDAARSQTLHYEAKLAVTSDYQQLKNNIVSMETERKHLLENVEKERSIGARNEEQLQDVITSLRDQLSRPSKTENEALQELANLKHKHFRDVETLKSQVSKIQCELEREQQGRVTAQTELREQFMECRAHHALPDNKPHTTDFPDFLKKYLSSVNLEEERRGLEEDVSDNSQHLVSDSLMSHSSSDSILRPTKSIVANSRKLFAQLEQEEAELEREFSNFKHKTHVDFPNQTINKIYQPSYEQLPPKTVTFEPAAASQAQSVAAEPRKQQQEYLRHEPQQPVLDHTESTMSSQSTITNKPTTPRLLTNTAPTEKAPVHKSAAPAPHKPETDMMAGLDPVMEQYLKRVMESKQQNKTHSKPDLKSEAEDLSNLQMDKTDSDFSW